MCLLCRCALGQGCSHHLLHLLHHDQHPGHIHAAAGRRCRHQCPHWHEHLRCKCLSKCQCSNHHCSYFCGVVQSLFVLGIPSCWHLIARIAEQHVLCNLIDRLHGIDHVSRLLFKGAMPSFQCTMRSDKTEWLRAWVCSCRLPS